MKEHNKINRLISLGHVGVGGERGWVYSTNGVCCTLSATQYKDPHKVLVKCRKENSKKFA